ncbi:hypothetical protein [Thalassobaculum salexigens]|uniref:hypothetical protein n=1 Tax=Thalassobaculum salexigens TaxID=455360 RepID=UPI0012EB6E54|nr:hypothetical protein [Thalassobaculum salexigens]
MSPKPVVYGFIGVSISLVILISSIALVEVFGDTIKTFQTFASGVLALLGAIVSIFAIFIVKEIDRADGERRASFEKSERSAYLCNKEKSSSMILLGFTQNLKYRIPYFTEFIDENQIVVDDKYYPISVLESVHPSIVWRYLRAVNRVAMLYGIFQYPVVKEARNESYIVKMLEDTKSELDFAYELLHEVAYRQTDSSNSFPLTQSEVRDIVERVEASRAIERSDDLAN